MILETTTKKASWIEQPAAAGARRLAAFAGLARNIFSLDCGNFHRFQGEAY
jgi:hypothetical protein